MDNSLMGRYRIYRETRFRTPSRTEREIGLWADRIGGGAVLAGAPAPRGLRLLGQYAAVAVETGAGRLITAQGGALPVTAGDVILVFPEEPTAYHPDPAWTSRWVVWNGPEAGRLARLGYLSRQRPVVPAAAAVREAYERLFRLMEREDAASVLERKEVLLRLILELHRAAERRHPPSPAQRRMAEAVDYLRQHAAEGGRVPELARRFGLSPAHLRRLFREGTGWSPVAFVTGLRMARARELLSMGIPVKEAADRVGYADLFYFMRVFKKTHGVSPGRFLKRLTMGTTGVRT
jgi:AraC family transcriptional regulator of arabinose operon